MTESERKHKQLIKKWSKMRPSYGDFHDGPSSWETWVKQNPKILFLLKEPHSDFLPAYPIRNMPIERGFFLNIGLWHYAIKSFFCDSKRASFNNAIEEVKRQNVGELMDQIAIVNVKKKDENKSISNNADIKSYAKSDKDGALLKKQIDIIDPNIVICGNTMDSYDLIYYDDENYNLRVEKNKCKIWEWSDRLVVDFWHPANRKKTEELFNTLLYLLKNHQNKHS